MQFTTLFTILTASSVAMSVAVPMESKPQNLPNKGDNSADYKCSNNQKAACCNTFGSSNAIGSILGSVLGGSCGLTVIGGACTQGSIACCDAAPQTGLVNVQSVCVPITA